jgi:hypothetical protein
MPEVLTVRLDAKSEWRLDRLAAATARGKSPFELTRNRARLLEHDAAGEFFRTVVSRQVARSRWSP